MERRQFQGYNCDLAELQKKIETYFVGKGYRATNFHKDTIYLTQAHKNEMGARSIFTKIVGTPANFEVLIGFGERIRDIRSLQSTLEKIPLQIKLLLGEPMLEKNFWNYVTTQADLKRNTYGLTKANVPEFPQVWKEREIIKEIEVVYCRYCGAKNSARRASCTQCGGNLH